MLKSKIKTHTQGKVYKQPHFFILNKGLNSGKPFRHYVVNSFVFLADDKDERDFYYFMLLGFWELRLFRPYLKGSVIEFVRLGDVVDVIDETFNAINTNESQSNLHLQLNYLMQLRKALFSKYLKK
ncbi:MAG: hypothetical protein IPL10_14020 [Bacteroidetes bacterium]|nr:hypothetical protein [Bacteroidota bacterium]